MTGKLRIRNLSMSGDTLLVTTGVFELGLPDDISRFQQRDIA